MYLIKQRIRAHLFVNFALYKYLIILIIIITSYLTISLGTSHPPDLYAFIFLIYGPVVCSGAVA